MDAADVFVLDGSVTMAWGSEDEAGDYAAAILDLKPADAARFLAILGTFPVTVDGETATHAWHETTHLARAHGLSVYDAAYLELAIRLGVALATLDGKLKAAAVAVGVPPFDVHRAHRS